MDKISVIEKQLPDNIEDLTKFALIGREKLIAVRAEIRAINKVGLAKEVHEQKLKEAQEIAEAVLDAEVQIGKLLEEVPKAKNQYATPTDGGSTPKQQITTELGISHPERYQTLAKHIDVVEEAKADARANGRIVTRADVINQVVNDKKKEKAAELKKAKEEHQSFIEDDSPVISFEDVQNDKKNREKISTAYYESFINDATGVTTKSWLDDDSFKDLLNGLTKSQRETMKNYIQMVHRHVIRIGRLLEEF